MRIITGELKRFGECETGDIIGLTPTIDMKGDIYLNIKVDRSLAEKHDGMGIFNVINFVDGKPRTFFDSEQIYVYKRSDIYGY